MYCLPRRKQRSEKNIYDWIVSLCHASCCNYYLTWKCKVKTNNNNNKTNLQIVLMHSKISQGQFDTSVPLTWTVQSYTSRGRHSYIKTWQAEEKRCCFMTSSFWFIDSITKLIKTKYNFLSAHFSIRLLPFGITIISSPLHSTVIDLRNNDE